MKIDIFVAGDVGIVEVQFMFCHYSFVPKLRRIFLRRTQVDINQFLNISRSLIRFPHYREEVRVGDLNNYLS